MIVEYAQIKVIRRIFLAHHAEKNYTNLKKNFFILVFFKDYEGRI